MQPLVSLSGTVANIIAPPCRVNRLNFAGHLETLEGCLARRAERNAPKIAIIAGRSGTGKSTLAAVLTAHWHDACYLNPLPAYEANGGAPVSMWDALPLKTKASIFVIDESGRFQEDELHQFVTAQTAARATVILLTQCLVDTPSFEDAAVFSLSRESGLREL